LSIGKMLKSCNGVKRMLVGLRELLVKATLKLVGWAGWPWPVGGLDLEKVARVAFLGAVLTLLGATGALLFGAVGLHLYALYVSMWAALAGSVFSLVAAICLLLANKV